MLTEEAAFLVCYAPEDAAIVDRIPGDAGIMIKVLIGDLNKELIEDRTWPMILVWSRHVASSPNLNEALGFWLRAWSGNNLYIFKADNTELPVGLRDLGDIQFTVETEKKLYKTLALAAARMYRTQAKSEQQTRYAKKIEQAFNIAVFDNLCPRSAIPIA